MALPCDTSDADHVLPIVDWSPFKTEEVYKLGLADNWPQLRQILAKLTNSQFGVTEAALEAIVDDARLVLDTSWGNARIGEETWNNHYIVTLVMGHEGNDDAADVLQTLLAAGVDPDKANQNNWRPSHSCGWLGRLDMASSLFLCRPDMSAKNKNGCTPLQAAEGTYSGDHKFPRREASRPYVAQFLRSRGLEAQFPTLAELALLKKWFAVRNLIRRQVVQQWEFTELFKGKTAAEWAQLYGETMLAKEIQYYEQPSVTRLAKAAQELLELKRKVSPLKTKLAQMEELSVEKDSRLKNLAEAVDLWFLRLESSTMKVETAEEADEVSFKPCSDDEQHIMNN